MRTNLTKLMAALALLVFMAPSMVGWGQTNASYTIIAKTGSGDGSQISTSTNVSEVFTETTYPNAFTTATKAYYNGTSGVKLGTSSDPGTLTFSLKQAGQVNAQTITVRAKLYNSSKAATINVNSGTAQSLTSSFADYTFTINQNITSITLASSKYCWINSITVSYEAVTYTVTLADDNTTLTQSSPGASVTLPTRSAIGDYAFAGWSSTEVANETTTAPTIISAGAYTPTDDITLYPVYTRTETSGSPTTHAVNITISDYASAHGWIDSQQYTSITMDENVTANGKSNGNNSKYYSSNGTWRHYATNNGEITIATTSGTLNSVTFTYSGNTLKNNGNNVTSGTAYSVSGTSAVFVVSGTSSNTQVSAISVSYTIGGGSTTYYWSWPTTGPIITANAPATLAYDAAGGEFGYSILNPTTGVTLNAASNSDWITNVAVNPTNSTVTFSTSTNTTYTQRTGTIILSYTGATDKVVTITQEAAPDPVITASNVEIAFDATSGSIAYNITNEPTPAGTMTAAVVSGSTIANLAIGTIENNAVAFTCAANNSDSERTATVTLTYTYDNNRTVTKNVTITQAASEFDYAILPFAFDGGRAAIANTNGLTQENLGTDYANSPKLRFEKGNKDNDGKYSTLILHFNERPGELSYDILGNSFSGGTFKVQVSTDGDTYTDWATYTQLTTTLQHITFNNLDENVRYIKWIYTQKVNGNVALGNIKLKKYEAPQPYTLSIEDLLNVRVYASAPGYSTITNGQNFTIPSVTVVTLIVQYSDDFVLDEIMVLDEGNNPISLTPVPQTQNQWTFYMPNSDVTVSASVVAAHPPVNYVLASSVESGKRYIIVGQKNGQYYAMGPQKPNNRIAKLISVEGNTATVTRSDVLEFTITSLQEPGFYSIYDETEPGYLYAGDASENRLLTEATLDEDGEWEITINAQTGVASIVASNSNNINVMQFNSNYELFNCYGSASQNPVYLYQIDDGFPLEITGYTGTKDHYYLISTPVTVDPATVDGMVTGDYDLYYFDQSQELEWINYKGDANLGHPGHFNLVPGKGYLYAKKATSGHSTYTFNLSGDLYDGTGDIPVVEGWNLIGNPYTEEAEIEYYESYYIMNESIEGSEIIASEVYSVLPMQAVFFYNEEGASTVTFSRMTKDTRIAGISLNVSRDNTLVDRAIVRFGEGRQMPKFQLNPNSTKVFIPQNDKDYAVVRSANDGEMPVSFKAEHNGTYTLSADITELEMSYLHLIDNMTGADIDLLATPSYTFDARTTDYESRFKLVFSSICEDADGDNETFAFFNGSEWTVSNTGEATLQVVDVMGRIVDSQSIQGNATLNLDQTPGIYMLRLVNGNDVKVQKIVVR